MEPAVSTSVVPVPTTTTEDPLLQAPGLCRKIKHIRWSLLLIFLVGFVSTTPSSVIPGLQQDTFGNHSYIIVGAFSTANGLAMTVYTPFIGSISDRVGRRAALTIVSAISIIPYVTYSISQNFWAFSFTNCYLALFDPALSLIMSSIADTEQHYITAAAAGERTDHMTESFALGTSLMFLGLSISPFLGAFLSNEITFITCAAMQLMIVLISWFGLPRQQASCDNGKLKVLAPAKPSISRLLDAIKLFPQLRWIIAIIACNAVAEQLLDQFLLQYLNNALNFSATNEAIVIAVLGLGGVFGMLFVTRFLVRRWGNLMALRVALASNVIICLLYAVLPFAYPVIAITALSVVGMGVYPCACALAMRCTKEYDAGTAQGLAQGARMIASVVMPFAFGFLFDATQNFVLPGIAFAVGAVFVLASLVLTRTIDLNAIDAVQVGSRIHDPLLNGRASSFPDRTDISTKYAADI